MPATPELKRPHDLIRRLEKTPQFLEGLSTGSRERALGSAARIFAARMEERPAQTMTERLDTHAVNLIATLPNFAHSSWQLDILADRKADRQQKLPHIRKVIPFNHALRDLIDDAPGLTESQVIDFCDQASQGMLDHNHPSDPDSATVAQHIRESLVGMQYETGLEQILWNIPGVEDVQKATPEQELEGIDVITIYDGVPVALDAKASPHKAKSALVEYEYYAHQRSGGRTNVSDGGYPLWTGIEHSEFHGGFRVDQTTVDRCTPAVEATLQYLAAAKSPSTQYA